MQQTNPALAKYTFQMIVLVSVIPAFLAVLALALGAKDVKVAGQRAAPQFAFRTLGRPFMIFMVIVGIFTLGNSSDAFLMLRAQDARPDRRRHPGHADHLQPDLHAGLHARRARSPTASAAGA